MKIIDLGLISYQDAVALQVQTLLDVQQGAEEVLYLLEHSPVITLGRNGGFENLHVNKDFLAAHGIELVQSTRGGNITCHFPGQLVAYPIFRIDRRKGGLRQFFTDLESIMIAILADFSLEATRQRGRLGVWVGQRKIGSIGVAVQRWTTYHGFALNISSNLDLFDLISLCGLPDAAPTSLHKELEDDSTSIQEVKRACIKHFQSIFTHPPLA